MRSNPQKSQCHSCCSLETGRAFKCRRRSKVKMRLAAARSFTFRKDYWGDNRNTDWYPLHISTPLWLLRNCTKQDMEWICQYCTPAVLYFFFIYHGESSEPNREILDSTPEWISTIDWRTHFLGCAPSCKIQICLHQPFDDLIESLSTDLRTGEEQVRHWRHSSIWLWPCICTAFLYDVSAAKLWVWKSRVLEL